MIPRQTILTGIVVSLLGFQLLVLIFLVSFPYLPDPGFSDLSNSIYLFLAPLSTVLLLGLLYGWLLKLVTRQIRRYSLKFNSFLQFLSEPFQKLISHVKTSSLSESADHFKVLARPRLILGISILVSILLVLLPYRPDLNPTGILVGIDSPRYIEWINQMQARSWLQAIQYSFVEGLEGSRPLLLVPLYMVALMGVSPSSIIEYLPTVLAPLLSLSTYTFVRYGQGSRRLAGLASLFTSVSFYTTVGLFGGYYANWLALTLTYLFMTSLLIFSGKPSVLNYAVTYAFSLGLFLTHPWTWVLVAAVSLAFTFSLWSETKNLVHVSSIIGIIATGVVLDVVKNWVFSTRTVAADIATKTPGGVGSLLGFWNNLVDALLYTHDGLMADWLLLGLGLMAAFVLRFKDRFERLILLWIGIPSIPFLVLDSYDQTRIVYDLPIPILTALATVRFLPWMATRWNRWSWLVILLLILVIACYALQGVLLL